MELSHTLLCYYTVATQAQKRNPRTSVNLSLGFIRCRSKNQIMLLDLQCSFLIRDACFLSLKLRHFLINHCLIHVVYFHDIRPFPFRHVTLAVLSAYFVQHFVFPLGTVETFKHQCLKVFMFKRTNKILEGIYTMHKVINQSV